MNKRERITVFLIILILPVILLGSVNSFFSVDRKESKVVALNDENLSKKTEVLIEEKKVNQVNPTEAKVEKEKPQLNYVDKQNPMKYISSNTNSSELDKNIVEVISIPDKMISTEPTEEISRSSQSKVTSEEIEKSEVAQRVNQIELISEETVGSENNSNLSQVDLLQSTSQKMNDEMKKINYNENDLVNLANFVDLAGSTYEEKLGLASLIINRVKGSSTTISNILLEKGQFPHQAELASHVAKESSYEAAIEALNGSSNVGESTYYYSTDKYNGAWHKENLKEVQTIGKLKFFVAKDVSILSQSETLKETSPNEAIDKEEVKVATVNTVANNSSTETRSIKYKYSDEEFDLLAKLVWAEARGEPYEGKVAVAASVLNRYSKANFTKSIKDIVYAPKQYQPVSEGKIDIATPSAQDFEAVVEALNGIDPTNGATSFYAPKIVYSAWHESLTHTVTIGSHKFFK